MGKKELSHVGELNDALPNIHWDKLLFSAKESVYKAWFPTHKTWLDFSDCEIAFFLDAQCLGKHPDDLISVSYTHLDVYKRQLHFCSKSRASCLIVPSSSSVYDFESLASSVRKTNPRIKCCLLYTSNFSFPSSIHKCIPASDISSIRCCASLLIRFPPRTSLRTSRLLFGKFQLRLD